ncbi:MAG: ionic transporter y4hA [Ignavibacteria bacterium]|nr:ionic transporter y4hA [Ignavibacteria bacterium]
MRLLLQWTIVIPLLAWVLLYSGLADDSAFFKALAGILLMLSIMSAVHHSEIIAHRVGEPFGTIILAVAVTIIEVSIIISLMIPGGQQAESLARDTVFSATMLILNGIVGICLFIGGLRFREQNFSKHSATIGLVSIVSILVFTMILPSYTTSIEGPYYSKPQLVFVSLACLIIYGSFLFAQTRRHREYFLTDDTGVSRRSVVVSNKVLSLSLVFLLVSLGIVVLLAKELSPTIETFVVNNDLPKSLVGVIIAAVILLPEGIAAIFAAASNKVQTSLNLALGSALASIGLTIPSVAVVSGMLGMNLILGLDIKSIILLGLSIIILILSLTSGRSNFIYGIILLINLLAFIFLMIYP